MPTSESLQSRPHRPKALMVFATAFIAGAVAAVGINRALDVHLSQAKPKVESEPIFVALRSLPPGTPVTIWDVALRDWPKAMMPSTALRAHDPFEGMVLRHPLREGQPLLSVQLTQAEPASDITPTPMVAPFARPIPLSVAAVPSHVPSTAPAALPPAAAAEADLWASTQEPVSPAPIVATPPAAPSAVPVVPAPAAVPQPMTVAGEPTIAEPPADAMPPVATQPAETVSVVTGPPVAAPAAAATTPTAVPVQSVVRYLVVPERIAMQADHSFVAAAATAPAATAAAPPQPAPVEKPAAAVTKDVPPVAQHPGSRRPQPAPVTKRPPQAKQTQATKPAPQQPSRPVRSQGNQPAETSRPQGVLGTMFPNLRAGIEAVDAEMRRDRQEPPTDAQPQSQPRKTKPQPPSQNAAGWPRLGSSSRSF